MDDLHRFVKVEFCRFKAFKSFSLELKRFNILVGPNNAGKSTVLAAFRILAAGLRRATSRKPTLISGPQGVTLGYQVALTAISVAEENIFFDYDDSEAASIIFNLSNGNSLMLYFPEAGVCNLIPDAKGRPIHAPSNFEKNFKCSIGFVPVLGPVEHQEQLYEKETARLSLFNYRAARNFRNIWYHYPSKFDEFRASIQQTWPGMDIEPPEVERIQGKAYLFMYCPEQRKPREIFWSGFGFQVWCQMLTHIIQWSSTSIFLIDEPDIYLHSELQRQLFGILRNLGPDILIATHSTELITEAEADDIVIIDKSKRNGRRIKNPNQLEEVFSILGSNANPILTQLAKTRRVLFVEGKDFQVLGKFARKLGYNDVGNRRSFAVVPVEGFNPERVKNLKAGMETTLGTQIIAAVVLDRDFRCKDECDSIVDACKKFCNYVSIHQCKEIENFLLVPSAVDRALAQKLSERNKRNGKKETCGPLAEQVFAEVASSRKNYIISQLITERRRFERAAVTGAHEADISERALNDIEIQWRDDKRRLSLVPGKEALSVFNKQIQETYAISVTPTAIIDAMRIEEVPAGINELIEMLQTFSTQKP